ncbi:TPA: hypothetical protein ACLGYR_003001 [Acinetobacter baumannii]|nr:hypothetical protein [Acinetobacter baumannii]EKX9959397.1 hypothetical protein [Acinetobacter baumannii]EKY0928414.1 hypothetical protein [Acinetobacter baumannii]EKY1173459.1 hypothetical protein [Acinetobacter baumannii]HCW3947837.1 hypothetical protein [Acinetobacter baumannii]
MSNIFNEVDRILDNMNKGDTRTFHRNDYRSEDDWLSVWHYLCKDTVNSDKMEVIERKDPLTFTIRKL